MYFILSFIYLQTTLYNEVCLPPNFIYCPFYDCPSKKSKKDENWIEDVDFFVFSPERFYLLIKKCRKGNLKILQYNRSKWNVCVLVHDFLSFFTNDNEKNIIWRNASKALNYIYIASVQMHWYWSFTLNGNL